MLASSTSEDKLDQEAETAALQIKTFQNMSVLKSQFINLISTLQQSAWHNSSKTRDSIALLSAQTLALKEDVIHVRNNQSLVLAAHVQRLEQLEIGMALKASDVDYKTLRNIVNESRSLMVTGDTPSNAVQLLNHTMQQHVSVTESRLDAQESTMGEVSSSISEVSSKLISLETDIQVRAVKVVVDQSISGLLSSVSSLRKSVVFFLFLSFTALLWRGVADFFLFLIASDFFLLLLFFFFSILGSYKME